VTDIEEKLFEYLSILHKCIKELKDFCDALADQHDNLVKIVATECIELEYLREDVTDLAVDIKDLDNDIDDLKERIKKIDDIEDWGDLENRGEKGSDDRAPS